MMRTKIYKRTNLSPAKLNSDTNEDLNKKKVYTKSSQNQKYRNKKPNPSPRNSTVSNTKNDAILKYNFR